jgi:hypothetical protein
MLRRPCGFIWRLSLRLKAGLLAHGHLPQTRPGSLWRAISNSEFGILNVELTASSRRRQRLPPASHSVNWQGRLENGLANLFWTVNEVALAANEWHTQITLLSLNTNRPALTLSQNSPNVLLSWQMSADPAYGLQMNTNLAATGAWLAVSNQPVAVMSQNLVTLPATGKNSSFSPEEMKPGWSKGVSLRGLYVSQLRLPSCRASVPPS